MTRVAAAGSLAVALLALVAAGCGGGGTTTVIRKTVSGPTTTTTTTQSTHVPPSTGPTTAEPQPSRTVHVSSFESPSGNIGCDIVGGVARCDIVRRSWSPPPRPSSCPNEVNFGQGLEVGRSGAGRFVCAGDTAMNPSAPPLAYGSASQVGLFACLSRTTGMTCTNRVDNHGFEISSETYRVF
jgi:hypothetical protein